MYFPHSSFIGSEDGGKVIGKVPSDLTKPYLEEDRTKWGDLQSVRLYVLESTIQQEYNLSLSGS